MKFAVVGANKESGEDVKVTLDAASQADAEQLAAIRGILVESISVIPTAEPEAISLVDETPGEGASEAPHATLVIPASSPSDMQHKTDGRDHSGEHKTEAACEYHIVMNQALYLLEVAVNKYIRDGWMPQGGLTVGISNNQMQYFQALIRHKK